MRWIWSRLDGLDAGDVYDLLALRSRVFVVEQACAYLDADGVDRQAFHLLGRDDEGRGDDAGAPSAQADRGLRACLRLVDPGVKYAEPSIGRVVTAPEARGLGLGRMLMREGIARCALAWPGRGIRISAQARLTRFYRELGFEPVGAHYLEDGIPHLEMLLQEATP